MYNPDHTEAWGSPTYCGWTKLRYFSSKQERGLTNSVAPEPEGSSPHSQQPANGPYPEPGESPFPPHPLPPTSLPKVHFDPILPSTPLSF
jgi:hypothetical protein